MVHLKWGNKKNKKNLPIKISQFVNRFNSTAVILLFSPLFVVAIEIGAYIITSAILIGIAIFTILKHSKYYFIILPPLIYLFYQFILLVVVPITINFYNFMEYYITGPGTILLLFFLSLGIAYIIMRLPIIPLKKLGRLNVSTSLAKAFGALLIVFILEPIIMLLTSEDFHTLGQTAADPNVQAAIWLSIGMAGLATLIALLLGIPVGYLLARRDFTGRAFIQGIVDVPIVMPHLVAGIALLMVFGVNGIIGAPLENLGIRFVDAWPGIVVAMLFVSAPFVVNSSRDGFAAVDKRLENVARSLGANELQAFSKVSLPLATKSIITGAIMSWARAISEFGAVIIIVYFPMVAPTLIYDRFTSFGLVGSRPVAVLLILICLTVFIVLRFLMGIDSIKYLRTGGGI